MSKNKTAIIWLCLAAIIIWLLWRNRSKIAPVVFNEPPETYLTYNYPNFNLQSPQLYMPESKSSCGCNPQASQYLSGVADSINAAQNNIEEQLRKYVDSINANLATTIIQ